MLSTRHKLQVSNSGSSKSQNRHLRTALLTDEHFRRPPGRGTFEPLTQGFAASRLLITLGFFLPPKRLSFAHKRTRRSTPTKSFPPALRGF